MNRDNAPSKEDNIFEEYYELISVAVVRGEHDGVDLNTLKRHLASIEQSLNKTLFKLPMFWETAFYKIIYLSLKKFLDSFKIVGFEYRVLYLAFYKYLSYLLFLSKNATKVNEEDTYSNFDKFFPVYEFASSINPEYEFDLNPPEDYQSIEKFERILGVKLGISLDFIDEIVPRDNTLDVFCNKFRAVKIEWDETKLKYIVIKKFHYMTIELVYDKGNREVKLEEFALSLYLITSGLKQLPGTRLEVLDIKKGSIRVKLRFWMDDDEAKKNAQDLLQGAKNSATATQESVPKTPSSTQGNLFDAEREATNSELEYLTPSQRRKFIENQLEKDRLMNESLRLQNAKASLEILKMSHEIVGQGFSTPKDIEAIINYSLFFQKIAGNIVENREDIGDIT